MPLLNPPGTGSAYPNTKATPPGTTQPPGTPNPTAQAQNAAGWAGNVGSSVIGPLTSGWYVIVASVGSILASNTRFAPIVAGILGVSLIFQLNLLIQKK